MRVGLLCAIARRLRAGAEPLHATCRHETGLPGPSELVAAELQGAVADAGLPEGTFWILHNHANRVPLGIWRLVNGRLTRDPA